MKTLLFVASVGAGLLVALALVVGRDVGSAGGIGLLAKGVMLAALFYSGCALVPAALLAIVGRRRAAAPLTREADRETGNRA